MELALIEGPPFAGQYYWYLLRLRHSCTYIDTKALYEKLRRDSSNDASGPEQSAQRRSSDGSTAPSQSQRGASFGLHKVKALVADHIKRGQSVCVSDVELSSPNTRQSYAQVRERLETSGLLERKLRVVCYRLRPLGGVLQCMVAHAWELGQAIAYGTTNTHETEGAQLDISSNGRQLANHGTSAGSSATSNATSTSLPPERTSMSFAMNCATLSSTPATDAASSLEGSLSLGSPEQIASWRFKRRNGCYIDPDVEAEPWLSAVVTVTMPLILTSPVKQHRPGLIYEYESLIDYAEPGGSSPKLRKGSAEAIANWRGLQRGGRVVIIGDPEGLWDGVRLPTSEWNSRMEEAASVLQHLGQTHPALRQVPIFYLFIRDVTQAFGSMADSKAAAVCATAFVLSLHSIDVECPETVYISRDATAGSVSATDQPTSRPWDVFGLRFVKPRKIEASSRSINAASLRRGSKASFWNGAAIVKPLASRTPIVRPAVLAQRGIHSSAVPDTKIWGLPGCTCATPSGSSQLQTAGRVIGYCSADNAVAESHRKKSADSVVLNNSTLVESVAYDRIETCQIERHKLQNAHPTTTLGSGTLFGGGTAGDADHPIYLTETEPEVAEAAGGGHFVMRDQHGMPEVYMYSQRQPGPSDDAGFEHGGAHEPLPEKPPLMELASVASTETQLSPVIVHTITREDILALLSTSLSSGDSKKRKAHHVRADESNVLFQRGDALQPDVINTAYNVIDPEHEDICITAEVEGTTLYNVSVWVDVDGIYSFCCSCPFYTSQQTPCKHIVATLLVYSQHADAFEYDGNQSSTDKRRVEMRYDAREHPTAVGPGQAEYGHVMEPDETPPTQPSAVEEDLSSGAGHGNVTAAATPRNDSHKATSPAQARGNGKGARKQQQSPNTERQRSSSNQLNATKPAAPPTALSSSGGISSHRVNIKPGQFVSATQHTNPKASHGSMLRHKPVVRFDNGDEGSSMAARAWKTPGQPAQADLTYDGPVSQRPQGSLVRKQQPVDKQDTRVDISSATNTTDAGPAASPSLQQLAEDYKAVAHGVSQAKRKRVLPSYLLGKTASSSTPSNPAVPASSPTRGPRGRSAKRGKGGRGRGRSANKHVDPEQQHSEPTSPSLKRVKRVGRAGAAPSSAGHAVVSGPAVSSTSGRANADETDAGRHNQLTIADVDAWARQVLVSSASAGCDTGVVSTRQRQHQSSPATPVLADPDVGSVIIVGDEKDDQRQTSEPRRILAVDDDDEASQSQHDRGSGSYQYPKHGQPNTQPSSSSSNHHHQHHQSDSHQDKDASPPVCTFDLTSHDPFGLGLSDDD